MSQETAAHLRDDSVPGVVDGQEYTLKLGHVLSLLASVLPGVKGDYEFSNTEHHGT